MLAAAAPHLSRPPFPPELYDSVAEIRAGRDGSSLIDLWRAEFRASLTAIGSQQTWQLQRTRLLRVIADTFTWTSLYAASNEARHDAAWLPQVREAYPVLKDASPDKCKYLILQRWLVAICTSSCLGELGARLYGVDPTKDTELRLLDEFQTDLRKVQVALLDHILDASEDDGGLAERLADWHDETVVPILNDEWRLVALLEEDVINSSLDIAKTRARIDAAYARRGAAEAAMPREP